MLDRSPQKGLVSIALESQDRGFFLFRDTRIAPFNSSTHADLAAKFRSGPNFATPCHARLANNSLRAHRSPQSHPELHRSSAQSTIAELDTVRKKITPPTLRAADRTDVRSDRSLRTHASRRKLKEKSRRLDKRELRATPLRSLRCQPLPKGATRRAPDRELSTVLRQILDWASQAQD